MVYILIQFFLFLFLNFRISRKYLNQSTKIELMLHKQDRQLKDLITFIWYLVIKEVYICVYNFHWKSSAKPWFSFLENLYSNNRVQFRIFITVIKQLIIENIKSMRKRKQLTPVKNSYKALLWNLFRNFASISTYILTTSCLIIFRTGWLTIPYQTTYSPHMMIWGNERNIVHHKKLLLKTISIYFVS